MVYRLVECGKAVSFLFFTQCHSGFAASSSSLSLSRLLKLSCYPYPLTLCSAQVSIRASSCRRLRVDPTVCSGPETARLLRYMPLAQQLAKPQGETQKLEWQLNPYEMSRFRSRLYFSIACYLKIELWLWSQFRVTQTLGSIWHSGPLRVFVFDRLSVPLQITRQCFGSPAEGASLF